MAWLLCFVIQLHWWLPIAGSMWGLCSWTWSWNSAAEAWTQSPASSGQPQWLWSPSAGDCLSYCRPVLASTSSAGRQCRQWHTVVYYATLCHKYSQWIARQKSNCKIGCIFCFIWSLRRLGLLSFVSWFFLHCWQCSRMHIGRSYVEQYVWMCM